jgi:SAM-dependent methyltransferase
MNNKKCRKEKMHPSSKEKMQLVAHLLENQHKYTANTPCSIIEIGGDNARSYRGIFEEKIHCAYKTMHIRFSDAPTCDSDIIVNYPYEWSEIQDESYDVVISGHVFEHVEYFWLTLLEMRRIVKKEGILAIIAPSHWPEHRHPFDCWRFYADGMLAMMKYLGLRVLYASADHGNAHAGDAIGVGVKESTIGSAMYTDAHKALLKLLPSTAICEVSRGKPTYQSSASRKWQIDNTQIAGTACSGIFTGKFSFHTNYEQNPWLIVDLQKVYTLDHIKIFNRCDASASRAYPVDILLSVDFLSWSVLYQNNEMFGGIYGLCPLEVNARGSQARFIRLQLREANFFHLDQIQVFAVL